MTARDFRWYATGAILGGAAVYLSMRDDRPAGGFALDGEARYPVQHGDYGLVAESFYHLGYSNDDGSSEFHVHRDDEKWVVVAIEDAPGGRRVRQSMGYPSKQDAVTCLLNWMDTEMAAAAETPATPEVEDADESAESAGEVAA